jgi:O-antigen ligase
MQIPQLVYIVAFVSLLFYLVSKADRKWLLSAILFWLFSIPILGNPHYTISLRFAGFDVQSSRILFVYLFVILLLLIIKAKVSEKSFFDFSIYRLRFYELSMAIYIGIAILITAINVNEIGVRTVVANTIKLSTFLLLYFLTREYISLKDFRLLAVATVIFAIFSSLVGIYQFFGDASFFRIGVSRPAFGSFTRGNGFFDSEYDQGLFLAITLIIGMLTFKSWSSKAFIVATIPLGVFCTMHRASWIILAIALGTILIRESHRLYSWIFMGTTAVVATLFIVLNIPWQHQNVGNFIEQMIIRRLTDNTLDDRARYNNFAIYMIQRYPVGIGAYDSNVYIREANNHSELIDFQGGIPLIIHNGFLSAGLIYGVIGMTSFTLFLLSTLIYYYQKEMRSRDMGFMVLLTMILFFLINVTQDYSFLGNQLGLFIGLIAGSAFSQISHERLVSKTVNLSLGD